MGNKLCIEDLLKLEPFQQLPQSRLEWVCDRAETFDLPAGNVLVHEGDPHRGLFILARGQMAITRRSEGAEMPIGRHDAPAFFGEIQVLTDGPAPVTLKAITDCHLHEIEAEDFRLLLHECRILSASSFKLWSDACADWSLSFVDERRWRLWEQWQQDWHMS